MFLIRWALANSHISLHIPSGERITVSTQRKKNGQPKRPRQSLGTVLSNIHLLLRVPSFARWPLTLHFFKRDVYKAWEGREGPPTSEGLNVEADFGPEVGAEAAASPSSSLSSSQSEEPWGIHALPLDYSPLRAYAEKARNVFTFEREGSCVHCLEEMPAGRGLYAVCPNGDCEAVGHVTCWSRHVLGGDGDGKAVLPVRGTCPSCKGPVRWGHMMKELTLRVRGAKEVDKLLKKRRRAKASS